VIGSNNHRITAAVAALGYRVSDEGVVLNPKGRPRIPYLAPKRADCPDVLYASFSVKVEGKHHSCKVHQLVAFQKFGDAAFGNGVHVRHLNSDSTDNRPSNIAIGTASDNALDRDPEKRRQMALRAASARRSLTPTQVRDLVEMRRNGATGKQCAEHFGILKSTVSEILSGKIYSDLTGIPFTPRKAVAA
jgi:hypothetical protein